MADAKSSRGMIAVDKMGTKVLFLSTKEALFTFPDAATGAVHKLFTNREVRTAAFDLDGDELDFYDQLTRYVEDQSIAGRRGRISKG
jgi:hypothetical protein